MGLPGISCLLIALASLFQVGVAAAEGPWTRQVRYAVSADNNRQWQSAYDLSLANGAVRVRVTIRLLPAKNVNRVRLEKLASDWKEAAEKAWNDKLGVRIGNGPTLPILVDVNFSGPQGHAVIVIEGGSGADQLHWGSRSTGRTIAHEVGHMLGAFDEYSGGGTNPVGARIDSASLMGSAETGERVLPRHLAGVASELSAELGRDDVVIVEVP